MRLSTIRAGVTAAAFLVSASTHADWSVGWAVGATRHSLDDPDGPTASKSDTSTINALFIKPWGRDARLFAHFYSEDFSAKASPTDIGQKVETKGFLVSYQSLWRATTFFKPWVGIGVGISTTDYTARHHVDQNGFLIQTFPNISETNTHFAVNAAHEWAVGDNGHIGAMLQHRVGISRSDDATGAFIYYTYTLGGK